MILRNFLAAIDRTRAPLVFMIFTTLLNAFLNYLLIYGNFGFPRLELVGAGIASSISHAAGFLVLAILHQLRKTREKVSLVHRFFHARLGAFLRKSSASAGPIGVTIAFEALLFNAALFVLGRIGVNEVAAYQVALNAAALAFMMPLGLSMAGACAWG